MLVTRKLKTLAGLTAFIWLGVAAAKAPFYKERNLTVLPKDISDQKLDSIMQSYNIALGVKCDFCHAPKKGFYVKLNGVTDTLDFASDENSMKANARDMMRMTIEINTKHFYFDKNVKPEYLNVISCKTCHRGEPFPPEN
jgi:hypothetical protein